MATGTLAGEWRTLAGAQALAVIRSYIATARKQGLNTLDALRDAFTGNPWMPAARPGRRGLTLPPGIHSQAASACPTT